MSDPAQVLISYQGKPGLRASFSSSIGLDPDRGYVDLVAPTDKKQFFIQAPEPGPNRDQHGEHETFPVKKTPQPASGKFLTIDGKLEIAGSLILEQGETKLQRDNVYVWEAKEIDVGVDPANESVGHSVWRLELVDFRFRWEKEGLVQGNRNIVIQDGSDFALAVEFTGDGASPFKFPRFPEGVHESGIVANFRPFVKPRANDTHKKSGFVILDRRTLKDVKRKKLWSLLDLLKECLDALPTPNGFRIDRSCKAEKEFPIGIQWGSGRRAKEALGELLDSFGLIVALSNDNIVHVVPRFQLLEAGGIKHPDDISSEFRIDEQCFQRTRYNAIPEAVHVAGGPILQECVATSWEPVIKNDGTYDLETKKKTALVDGAQGIGEWIPLKDVLKAWGYSEDKARRQVFMAKAHAFKDVPGATKDEKDARRQTLVKYAWKAFRMNDPAERHFLPWEESSGKPFRCQVMPEGPTLFRRNFFLRTTAFRENDNLKEPLDSVTYGNVSEITTGEIPPAGFIRNFTYDPEPEAVDFDSSHGVIVFKRPIGFVRVIDAGATNLTKKIQNQEKIDLQNKIRELQTLYSQHFNDLTKVLRERGRFEENSKDLLGRLGNGFLSNARRKARVFKYLASRLEDVGPAGAAVVRGEEGEFETLEDATNSLSNQLEKLIEKEQALPQFTISSQTIDNIHIYEMRLEDPMIMLIYTWKRSLGVAQDFFGFTVGEKKHAFLIDRPDLIEWNGLNGISNRGHLSALAFQTVVKHLQNTPAASAGKDWAFAGFHPVMCSGLITQVAWEADAGAPEAITRVGEDKYGMGFDGRRGVVYTKAGPNNI